MSDPSGSQPERLVPANSLSRTFLASWSLYFVAIFIWFLYASLKDDTDGGSRVQGLPSVLLISFLGSVFQHATQRYTERNHCEHLSPFAVVFVSAASAMTSYFLVRC